MERETLRREKSGQGEIILAEVFVESVLLSDRVIELHRTDVSVTSSYLRLKNSPINLDGVCTGSKARPQTAA